MKRRKIVYQDGSYQILKPKDNGNWHGYGERKSMKGINDFLFRNKKDKLFDVEISKEIDEKITDYRIEQIMKSFRVLSKEKNLESKTI